MISVEDALERLLALATPLPVELVALERAGGRVLAETVTARRDQPLFAASAMDGYAIKRVEADLHAQFKVVGEAVAGRRFAGRVGAGQAVRIFTGAPVPEGADFVIIQEDVRPQGDLIAITNPPGDGSNIRAAGVDFRQGTPLPAPRRLTPQDVALLAAMNHAVVPVTRRPGVAILATGDELVMPGEEPGPDQIVAPNSYGLKAMLEEMGCIVRLLPIARDTRASIETALELAEGADLILTIGGASVGDHDLVAGVTASLGMDVAFHKVAMRPGKPLMAGRLGRAALIGLPGNPVSAMVCGQVFVAPVVRRMLGLTEVAAPPQQARLGAPLDPNGPRAHYMRATVTDGVISAFEKQDSSLLTVLSQANALIIRPPGDPARKAGDMVPYLML